MKTAKAARAWLYRDVVAASLRRKAARLTAADVYPDGRAMTAAQLQRCKREMLTLADKLEGKAARMAAQPETVEKGRSPADLHADALLAAARANAACPACKGELPDVATCERCEQTGEYRQ